MTMSYEQIQIIQCLDTGGLAYWLRVGVGKLWSPGRIWPATWVLVLFLFFCTACELRVVFTFLSDENKLEEGNIL